MKLLKGGEEGQLAVGERGKRGKRRGTKRKQAADETNKIKLKR